MTERLAPGVGEAFGEYTIESSLGRGGMGAVYLATHARLARKVALKVIAPELADDEEFRARFLRETQLAASLEHPNVIPIYDAGEVDGVLYLAMRYVAGPSLRMLLRERGALSAAETLAIAEQIGGALDTAHAAELVHRDVKPANILLSESGQHAFLCDFGLAKRSDSRGLTRTGSFLGTVDYAAPEQIEGRTLDGRADVYSLGCVLFHCLAGRPPYLRDTEYAVLHAHVAEPVPPLATTRPDLPRALDGVLLKAMAKPPDDRYASAGDLAGALADALTSTRSAPAAADEQTVERPGGKRRRRVVRAVAAVVAVAAIGTLAAVLATRDSGTKAPTDTTSMPKLGAVVLQLERILSDSAASRRAIGNVLADGFACRIKPAEARRKMDEVVASRRQTRQRVNALGPVRPAATHAVSLLENALSASIAADVSYRNGFRYASGCPPTSDYFKAAARADTRATKAKAKFVAAFNPLAMRFGRKTWAATAI